MEYFFAVLIVAAILAFLPASIAKSKGYSFGKWWLYGWLFFLPAFIHILVIADGNAVSPLSAADELQKYRMLADQGVLTEEEFQIKKEQLMKYL